MSAPPLPLMFVGAQRRCLLIGGGRVAVEKLERLLEADIRPRIVAAQVCGEMRALVGEHRLELDERIYRPGDTSGFPLTIVAINDRDVARTIHDEVQARGAMINCADDPELCNVFLTANLRRGDLTVVVGTSGASAGFASYLRDRIQAVIPDHVEVILERLRVLRRRLIESKHGDAGVRRAILNGLIRRRLPALVAQDYDEDRLYEAITTGQKEAGEVILIGAGPGNPALFNFGAAEALARADVVLYDALVNKNLLKHARADAVLEFVGKKGGGDYTPQEEIHRRLIDYATRGKIVARLKGGDPFVFARGAEERRALEAAGIKVTHISGVTSAIAALGAAGYPLTERSISDAVFITTGHRSVRPGTRLVPPYDPGLVAIVLMASKAIAEVTDAFMEAGWRPDTPAVLISRATLPDQSVLEAPLGRIASAVHEACPATPALFAVGQIISHRFEQTSGRTP